MASIGNVEREQIQTMTKAELIADILRGGWSDLKEWKLKELNIDALRMIVLNGRAAVAEGHGDAARVKPLTEELFERIRKIKAKADGAKELGSLAEAEAFTAKLVELLARHALTMSDLDLDDLEREHPVQHVRVRFDEYGIPRKRARSPWIEQLAGAVAGVNFCRILVYRQSNEVAFVGRQPDREVCEYLLVVLVRAINAAADQHYAEEWRRAAKAGDVTLARGSRGSFISGATSRICERLWQSRRRAEADAGATGTAIVLRRDTAVSEYVAALTRGRRGVPVPKGRRVMNDASFDGGRAWAETVSLDANAVKAGAPAPKVPALAG